MSQQTEHIIGRDDPILVTGASGFIGGRVVDNLLERGFQSIRCLVRTSSNLARLEKVIAAHDGQDRVKMVVGNLLSRESARDVSRDAKLILHLAAGTGAKSFADAYLNSVVTTRNLLDAVREHGCLRRFVSLSTFSVYSGNLAPGERVFNEGAEVEKQPESRAEAYGYGKQRQDELVIAYGEEHQLPYVLLRPGVVYGPGKHSITGRVGIDTFGFFIHMGGGGEIPLSYVDNCAEAIVLAGLRPGIDWEVFNVLDDELPTSRKFLSLYKKNVRGFRSIYFPKFASYLFCASWEGMAALTKGQLPMQFTRREWRAYWKSFRYSNEKLRSKLGWEAPVKTAEGLDHFFESCREALRND